MKKLLVLGLIVLSFLATNTCVAFGYSMRVPLAGDTLADKKLQRNTLMSVYLAVNTIMINSCKKMKIVNTKVTKEPYDLEYKNEKPISGKWEEVWTVNACKQEFDVPIEFVITQTGTSYVVIPKNVQCK